MKKIINIYKKAGETPLEAINRLRQANPEYQDVKITYAGRLDPLAEGVLILLAGDAVYEKEKYLKMDKEYEAEIVFGFETDTYDILGLPKKIKAVKDFNKDKLTAFLNNFLGKNKQSFPPYSSYKIKGKPLFEWAREGKTKEIEIPEKEREIYEIKILQLRKIEGKNLLAKINKKIRKIKGDFRQEEILKKWQEKMLPILSDPPASSAKRGGRGSKNKEALWIAKIKIKCSSGTYIRSIAHRLGQNLKSGAVLFGLKRTQAGEFKAKDSLRI